MDHNQALCKRLRAIGVGANVVNTGGGCRAIEVVSGDRPGEYVLITDGDACLPFSTERGGVVSRYGLYVGVCDFAAIGEPQVAFDATEGALDALGIHQGEGAVVDFMTDSCISTVIRWIEGRL